METTQKPRQEGRTRSPEAGTKKRSEAPRQEAAPVQERKPVSGGRPQQTRPGEQPRRRETQSGERKASGTALKEKETTRPAQRSAGRPTPRKPETAVQPQRMEREERRRTAPERKSERSPEENPEQRVRTRPGEQNRRAPEKRRSREKPAADQPQKKRARPAEQADRTARKNARRKPEELDPIPNKRRAYGATKPKKESAITRLVKGVRSALKKSAEKRKKNKSSRQGQPMPAVIYTEPAAFNRSRLIVQLVTVLAVVLALVIGLSVFFKVEHIYVSGANVYSESAITEVCGINKGDNLLTFSHARAAALIQANRPYVREVRFGIKLPDTVNIIIEEDDVVYAIKDETGQWWLINSAGRVVTQGTGTRAASVTQILGVNLDNPVPNAPAVAMESAPAVTDTTDPSGETVEQITPVSTTGAQRLDAALQIVKALESNDIVGSAASVDVSRMDDIILWYGTRYQVNLGDNTRLDYKIACMNSVIAQMSEYQSGVLDCSFTIWEKQVGYTPFS